MLLFLVLWSCFLESLNTAVENSGCVLHNKVTRKAVMLEKPYEKPVKKIQFFPASLAVPVCKAFRSPVLLACLWEECFSFFQSFCLLQQAREGEVGFWKCARAAFGFFEVLWGGELDGRDPPL